MPPNAQKFKRLIARMLEPKASERIAWEGIYSEINRPSVNFVTAPFEVPIGTPLESVLQQALF